MLSGVSARLVRRILLSEQDSWVVRSRGNDAAGLLMEVVTAEGDRSVTWAVNLCKDVSCAQPHPIFQGTGPLGTIYISYEKAEDKTGWAVLHISESYEEPVRIFTDWASEIEDLDRDEWELVLCRASAALFGSRLDEEQTRQDDLALWTFATEEQQDEMYGTMIRMLLRPEGQSELWRSKMRRSLSGEDGDAERERIARHFFPAVMQFYENGILPE